MRNLLTPRWMLIKTALSLVLAAMAGGLLVAQEPTWTTVVHGGRRLGVQPRLLLRVLAEGRGASPWVGTIPAAGSVICLWIGGVRSALPGVACPRSPAWCAHGPRSAIAVAADRCACYEGAAVSVIVFRATLPPRPEQR